MRTIGTIRLAGIAASLVLSTLAFRVEAVSIPILNNSFESPDVLGTYLDVLPDNWLGQEAVVVDGALYTFVENNASVGFTGGDGIQHTGIGEAGYIYQDLGVPFQANKTYRIDLAGAHRSGFNHAMVQFGLFSSTGLGTDLGTPGFMDLQGYWDGSGNPDADNVFDVLREASDLQKIDLNNDGIEALGHVYKFDTGPTPPAGNIVVFIRHQGNGDRVTVDNIRLDESPKLQKGDVDLDGDVDLTDLTAIQTNFRTSVVSRSLGDLDEDGFVDFTDYLEWKANYPTPASGALAGGSVPEPSSVILGVLAGLLTLCGGRRMRRERPR